MTWTSVTVRDQDWSLVSAPLLHSLYGVDSNWRRRGAVLSSYSSRTVPVSLTHDPQFAEASWQCNNTDCVARSHQCTL
jgi:hypothetical protein